MITSLEGIVEDKQPTRVVLNVSGVGYEVFVPLSSAERIPAPGRSCRLFIHDYLRADQHALFGFASPEERRMFEMLLGINGVGPRLALSVLSGLRLGELKSTLLAGDARRLSTIKGIGKKTAERIVLEMRGKLDTGDALQAAADTTPAGADFRDAVLALVALGYRQPEAQDMIRRVTGGQTAKLTVEEIVRRSLAM